MKKDSRRLVFNKTPLILYLLILPLFYAAIFSTKSVSYDEWKQLLSNWRARLGTRNVDNDVQEQEFQKFIFRSLVTGEDRTQLETTGFACNTAEHSEVCVTNKPVRIDTNTMTVHVLSDQPMPRGHRNVRPYARREDENTMNTITPVQILQGNNITPPACNYTHNVPAAIFSTSGFVGNLFHEFNEIIIPLFLTTYHFQSNLQFIVVDYKPYFVNKYNRILAHLSPYEVINPASNGSSVHCFTGMVVGLQFHNNLAINSSDLPEGYSMLDFKQFLREAYNLKVKSSVVSKIEQPVLVLISRKGSRMFLNEDEMGGMMEELGFRVVVVTPNRMANLDKFASVVNSCSVMVGAHGAGLANEVFLPTGAVMVQVVPWGLEWASNAYFGEPAPGMGVKYMEYKIEAEESSLVDTYGRDHEVIVDVGAVFAKGYHAARAVYVDGQNMKIDLVRFRKTLIEALRFLGQSSPTPTN
ncbi:alpha-1,3-arabinosyltransferase XAT3-like [Cornus florida]|uniref:alpha-1,3-arabinosyltransferase XAT3-like n=1 Tax=Cornus florida TaxID=4283 RepID=UPI00289D359A|nr:alpha-1,3-arabinosyltransferase XAT3-like [Cornus florida]